MIKKIALLGLLIIVSISLTACGGSQDSNTGSTKPFVGGSQGVSMEFVQGAPPENILDNGQMPFSIQLRLTNEGEQSLTMDGDYNYLEVSLEGIVPQQFGLDEDANLTRELEDNLKAAYKYPDGSVSPGTSTILSWNGLSYPSDLQGNDEKSFLVNLCYDYRTKSTTKVCLSDDSSSALFDQQSKEICDISKPKTTYNSGGPLHVENLRQNTAGENKVSVMFDVVHVGQGAVYEFGEAECDSSLSNRNKKGKVHLTASLPDGTPATINCGDSWEGADSSTTTGDITLLGAQGSGDESGSAKTTVNCILESNAGGTVIYDEALSIDLEYRYSKNLRKTVTIKNIGDSD
ncbi:MAG: hypothetical protein ACQESC_00545 [Nanobdellota archaeon]